MPIHWTQACSSSSPSKKTVTVHIIAAELFDEGVYRFGVILMTIADTSFELMSMNKN